MKKLRIYLYIFLLLPVKGNAQAWIKKADFGGAARYSVIGFSIGTRGYIGLGNNSSLVEYNDFWEWDQATDTWTQKANFPQKGREQATGFSIGTKGYVGLGGDIDSVRTDFWEWDQPSNTWTKKANFAGSKRLHAVGFSIGTNGYVCAGSYTQDLWEWNQSSNSWMQKASFGGTPRGWSTGFAIGKKGYIGTGTNGSNYLSEFWEWDGDTASATYNTWTQKANLTGGARINAVGFSIGTKGYIALGLDSMGINNLQDFWEWDQSNNSWTKKLDFVGIGRQSAAAFSIDNRGYIGTGGGGANDFWEYCDTCAVGSGVNELANTITISIYPNPSSGILNLESTSRGEIIIYSIAGERVFSGKFNSGKETVNLSDQEEGVYFLKFITEKASVTKKLVMQR